ncbi:8-oxo-dGTP diphosphatase [Kibdelosporangium banguiense]|uniref:8-oxo-dGTP diphosphatase n=1 Tax=Kibdelosporangium banguiense TaxID=1365924 RepID=A0ABS4TPV8_9PSEU|nr:NUDIX domain-containing protein [Kibdelosporangium banguiense]MBP2326442.1 8-oxo-dGTP diphosphatase [Kibdelosporangium banguiense]
MSSRDVRHKGVPMSLTWLNLACLPDVGTISSASVVPVTADGKIVLAKLARGLEIPGGDVIVSDPDIEAAARREAWEETCIRLGPLVLIQLVRVEQNTPLAVVRHVVVYAGRVTSMPTFVQENESAGRVVVSPDEYIERVGFGHADDRRLLVTQAMAAVR